MQTFACDGLAASDAAQTSTSQLVHLCCLNESLYLTFVFTFTFIGCC